MDTNIKTTFDGKVLPFIGETVYIVRRTMKINKVGKTYASQNIFDVELVKGEVCSLEYGATTKRVNGEYVDAMEWTGKAAVQPDVENGIVGGMVEFGPYTSSLDETETEKLLAFYREHGLAGHHNLILTGDFREVTAETLADIFKPDGEDDVAEPFVPERDELTAEEIEKCDAIDNAAYALILALTGKDEDSFEWDMQYIGEVADAAEGVLKDMGLNAEKPSI